MYQFKQNKYTRIYFNIINNAKDRTNVGYIERHHIIPKSLGGNNLTDNIVELTAREHFICHKILVKIVKDEDKHKMSYASWQLGRSLKMKGIIITNRSYESLKKQLSETYKGKKRAPFSDEWIDNMRLRAIGDKNNMYGKNHSDETKKLISKNRKNKTAGKNNPFYGKTHSEETKKIIIETNRKRKGIPKPKKECPHCQTLIAANLFNRYHNDNCKKSPRFL